SERGQDLRYNNIVALCSACLSRARREDMTPARLRDIADLWRRTCAGAPGRGLKDDEATEAYSQALRLSLSNDILAVKPPAIICRSILYYHPFHRDAQILLIRLRPLEEQLDLEDVRRDTRARSTSDEVSRRLVFWRFQTWGLLAIGIFALCAAVFGSFPENW